MSSTLYSRLKRIQETKKSPRNPPKKAVVEVFRESPWVAAGSGVWEMRTFLPLALEAEYVRQGLDLGILGGTESASPWEEWAWFDTETTGLSSGAGTVIFLFGIAYPRDGGWECRQVFLEDYPYEAPFLLRVQELISQFYGLVSYNGSTFDLPLLRTRFVMNGIPWQEPRHLDLLRPARRLWRDSSNSCSLGALEAKVLGIHRVRDVPGMLIPGLYQGYLKRGGGDPGQFEPLSDAFAHHQSDHWSMIQLTQVIGQVVVSLNTKCPDPGLADWGITRLGLLRFLVPRGFTSSDLDFLTGLDLSPGEGFAALVARGYLGLRNFQLCMPWLEVATAEGSLWALERLLVMYEHRDKNPRQALEFLEQFQRTQSSRWKEISPGQLARWQVRHLRLRRKCSNYNDYNE